MGFIMYYLTSCSVIFHSTIKHIVTRLATVWTVTLPDLNATVELVDNPIWTILGRARYWLIWKAAHEHTLCPYIMGSTIQCRSPRGPGGFEQGAWGPRASKPRPELFMLLRYKYKWKWENWPKLRMNSCRFKILFMRFRWIPVDSKFYTWFFR